VAIAINRDPLIVFIIAFSALMLIQLYNERVSIHFLVSLL